METSTIMRQIALEAAIKLAQYERNTNSYSIIAEAGRYFDWLMTNENQNNITVPVIPTGQNLDDEIPF